MSKLLNLAKSSYVLALYWIACFVATHVRLPPGEPLFPHFDKLVHFSMYAVLGLLLGLRLPTRQLAFVIGVYALLDETTQPIVGRTCDPVDLVCDLLGAGIGAYVAQRLLRVSMQRAP